jgi:hypothetical protein
MNREKIKYSNHFNCTRINYQLSEPNFGVVISLNNGSGK